MLEYHLTTPLYYVNASPHMGSAYTTMLCDMVVRYWQLRGFNASLLTGTDEHGGKIEKTAQDNNLSPIEHCNNISSEFLNLWDKLNINIEYFSRTSDPNHYNFVKEFWNKVYAKGDIYEANYHGLYCLACEDFKNERDLINRNTCPIHLQEVQNYQEKNYFFKLSKYTDRIKAYILEQTDFIIPEYRKNEVLAWLEDGLKDFPISRRSVNWGIPVPNSPEQTIYVWFDALLGYLSPRQSSNISYYHIVGKDILKFHAVYWLAMLMSADYPLPKKIVGHGFLTKDGQKMGKSLGNIINPLELLNNYGLDAMRFYFAFAIQFGADGDYTEQSFVEINNAYLANRLGNLVSRVFKLFSKNMSSKLYSVSQEQLTFTNIFGEMFERLDNHMKNFEINQALGLIFSVIDKVNLHLSDNAPWKLFKSDNTDDHIKAQIIITECLEAIRVMANCLIPFIPDLSMRILALYNISAPESWDNITNYGRLIKYPEQYEIQELEDILFARLEIKA